MKKVWILGLGLLGATSSVLANNKVEIESYSHQQRIEILQKADACIKAAKTKEEYRACEVAEKQSREILKSDVFEQRKQGMLQNLDTRRNCIAKAQTNEDLKACRVEKK
ncbi:hypothetical protein [Thiosulfativibrio zosterae]|uniref:Lysozyme inhibitor LprI N-terminal domain-containing protein n=1 Tax=Thiosulfativibrio zosterae TaxID=2675053 RepID=A0A6F8PJQ7_9GAMM|nr:hypothetical protein [Thiosulfativibrio zosterae]BBP42332.1 hypothetical protein THMIRHAT_00780 [Thiosulfativibrio zosterae]